ncbi:MAG TPA: kelch repeat-containing protein [Acidimicrobiales bacterium]|nr:kelch repeat-containing protein [Acidimicrobiales bacterium]
MVLLDGPTASKVATVPLGMVPNEVQQGPGGAAYVRADGNLLRVDGARLQVTSGAEIPMRPDDTVITDGRSLWSLGRNGTVVQQRDPATLNSVGAPLGFPGRVTSLAPARDGRLWAAGRATVASFAGARLRTRNVLKGMPEATVVLAADHVVAADPAVARAQVIDAGSGRATRQVCLDVPPDAVLSGGMDSPWLLAVASASATLTVSDLATGQCRQPVALDGPSDAERYGPAVEHGGRVYVPDHVAGRVLVVEGTELRSIDVQLPGRPFHLLAHNGFVWFDDPLGDTAGVITDGGQAVAISKSARPSGQADGQPSSEPAIQCSGPRQALVGSPTTFVAASALLPAPTRWEWSSSEATPGVGSGPAFRTAWATTGTKKVGVLARDAGGNRATCAVDVVTAFRPEPHTDQAVVPPVVTPPVDSRVPNSRPPPAPTTTTRPPPQPRFTVSPKPAMAGRPVTFADTTDGDHRVVGWTFSSGSPGTSAAASPTVTWAAPGSFVVSLTVERDGAAASVRAEIVVRAPGGLLIESTALAPATLHVAYAQSLSATGGLRPYTWEVAGGALPLGLVLDAATGQVTGTPAAATAAGATVTIGVTDATGQKTEEQVGLAVRLADRWQRVADPPMPPAGRIVTLLDGRVLATGEGGQSSPGQLYDPVTDTWTSTGAMNQPRSRYAATLLRDGRVLVAGGIVAPGAGTTQTEVFDPGTGAWSSTGSMQQARGDYASVLLGDGTVLVVGGAYNERLSLGTTAGVERFDPTTESWTPVASMPWAAAFLSATLLPDGRVLVAGGRVRDGTKTRVIAQAAIYDPRTDHWQVGPDMHQERENHSAVLVNGAVPVVGGNRQLSDDTVDPELFDPVAGTWTVMPAPSPLKGAVGLSVLRNGTAFAPGTPSLVFSRDAGWSTAAAAPITGASTLLSSGQILALTSTENGDPAAYVYG